MVGWGRKKKHIKVKHNPTYKELELAGFVSGSLLSTIDEAEHGGCKLMYHPQLITLLNPILRLWPDYFPSGYLHEA